MSSENEQLEERKERNRQSRREFIKRWAEYVKTHPDREWSRQQNKLINSMLESARDSIDQEEYIERKRQETEKKKKDGQ